MSDEGRRDQGSVVRGGVATLRLQTQDELLTLPRETVEEITPEDVSLMPDGLLQLLSDEQIRDLIEYLSGKPQVPLPKPGPGQGSGVEGQGSDQP